MKTAVTAKAVYVDPSALLKLYLHEAESRAMARWRCGHEGPIPVTYHGHAELTNGLCLAAFRGFLTDKALREALQALEDDFEQGRCVHADVPWRATLRMASDLSRAHTPALGTRTLDVLHVACAVQLECSHLLSFDGKQQALAKKVGLRLVRLGS